MKSNSDPKDSRMGVTFQPSSSSFPGAFGEVKVVHDGQNGATFTPSVSEDGVISWTNDRELDNPAPVNIKGPKGDPGEAGAAGPAGPKGDPGEAGPAGADGRPGKDGAPGKDGVDGQPGKDGADGQPGKDGDDYVLTEADKIEIAGMAAELVEIPDSGGNVDLTGYATEQFVREYAQPKGEYLTEVPDAYATKEFVTNKIAEADLGGEEVDLSGYAQKSELPTKVSQLENDKGYLTEHQDISGKLNASELPTAINTALAQAKESGEFDGKDGVDGKDGQDGSPGKDGSNGVSATHSWNGTTLTITSASGTSSADLKGDKGDKGDAGSQGVPGEKGETGAKGDKGDKGDRGEQGIQGIQGPPGEPGAKGDKGDKGDTGSAGTNGKDGKDGTSVTVKSVSESTADGGSNVVTFSDGKTLTVKNGIKGSKGDKGDTGATGATGAAGKDYSFDPTVYGLPVLELTGDTSPIAVSKDNKVTLSYVYGDRSGTCTLKGQGATSYKTAQALVNAGKKGKFNYTINFDTAFEANSGWGAQKKYCLKANFIDTTHSRNIVSCKLWGMSVKARSTVPSQLANLPNGGAIDGFPVIIMLNGEFHGLYTWNIPKDGWMFGLVEDTTKTQAIVGADDHTTATQFKEASMTGFEVEFVSDEDNSAWVETSLTRLISAVMNSNGSDLDTTVAQYLDWDSAIDHYIHTVVDKATDCVDKNYLLVTFDGVKWYMSAYDRDSIHGLNWDASGTTRPVSNVNFIECAETVRIYELIKRFKTNALKARYKELRGNILSESRIMEKFENFAWAMPSPVKLEDVKLYPTIMGSGVNTIDQIGRFVRQRLVRCDEWIDALPAQETPVEPEKPVEIVNQVPISTDTDGSIYNGTGYKDNARLSSSGGVSSSAQTGSVVTGFIPWTPHQPIRIKGATWDIRSGEHFYVIFYTEDKTKLDAVSAHALLDSPSYNGHLTREYDASSGVTTFSFDDPSLVTGLTQRVRNAKYFRINAYGKGADLIITVNQEIT